MKSNVTSFLESLEELNNANTIAINVPSIGREVEFKVASVSQQKELISTVFDGKLEGAFKRANVFNNLVENNSKEDLEFLLIDRDAIMLNMRKELIGSWYLSKGQEYDLNDLEPIDISSIDLTKLVEYDGVKVNLAVPSLKTDTAVNLKTLSDLSKGSSEEEILREKFNDVITHEIIKYVIDVTIDEMTVSFEEISVYERIKIINNLPLKLNQEIVNYISSLKSAMNKALTLPGGIIVEIAAGFLSGD